MFFELEKFAWKILIYYWPCFQKLPGSNLYYLIQHGSCKHLLMSTAINFCRITQVNKIFHFFPGSRSKTMMHFNWNRAIGVSRNYVKCYPFWSFPSETNIKQKKKKGRCKKGWVWNNLFWAMKRVLARPGKLCSFAWSYDYFSLCPN